ncbi:hypothetical protein ABBQ38_004548 [Trebouxia sp. C0009 RCD-2024]
MFICSPCCLVRQGFEATAWVHGQPSMKVYEEPQTYHIVCAVIVVELASYWRANRRFCPARGGLWCLLGSLWTQRVVTGVDEGSGHRRRKLKLPIISQVPLCCSKPLPARLSLYYRASVYC